MINENYVCEVVATYKKRKMKPVKVNDSNAFIELVRSFFPKNVMNHYECFGVIFFDQALNVKGYKIIATGGINNVAVDTRLVMQVGSPGTELEFAL